jgi:RNA 2',3'-cyclic 3'-phosphodiesterase
MLPDGDTRQCLTVAARTLKLDASARPVPAENYHMTLAFVGEVLESQLTPLLKVGRSQRARGFTVRFGAYEYWPKSQVLVAAALDFPASLEQLWRQIHTDLAQHNLALKFEHFRPHVTIARKVPQAPVLQAMSAFEWKVQAFTLMQSNTAGARSVYTVVDTWRLLDENAPR